MLAASADPFDHEQRHLIDRAQARELFIKLSRSCDGNLLDPGEYLRTTYFDTADGACTRSCEGPVRKRLRVREYTTCLPGNAPVLSGQCSLEYKESTGSYRAKQRWLGTGSDIRLALRGALASVPVSLASFFPGAHPVLTTWYRRQALMFADAGLRVTWDHDLSLAEPEPVGDAGNAAHPARIFHHLADQVVLELKWKGETPSWLSPILRTLGPPDESFSKFTYALRHLQHAKAPLIADQAGA